ncbi:WD40-repeat-containing domain protein [Roridomyces roridus]|uniref:WD40-repeat-containing domain protein n=1 Tax=Roridomyces roridus TaxID=1738132 RepID=A0AAD7BRU0_9AGAR|nr:WD40-repeat-containing domain protein [Roridomyces roridus]
MFLPYLGKDHLYPNDPNGSPGLVEFRLGFSMKLDAATHAMNASLTSVKDLKSLLSHLGDNYRGVQTLLSLAVAASELNSFAKAVFASINEVNKLLQEQDDCDNEVRDLVGKMAECLGAIADVKKIAREDLLQVLETVDLLLCDTASFVGRYRSQSASSRFFSLIRSDKMRDELALLTARFSTFDRKFDRGIAVQTASTTEKIHAQVLTDSDSQLLRNLKPGGFVHEPQECMADTRVDILRVITDWARTADGPNTFWLRGHPGTGKSAIAATVRTILHGERRLGASFFFRREDSATQTPKALWCSIAHDLALQSPVIIRPKIIEQLRDQKVEPNSWGYTDVLSKLITGPLELPPGEDDDRPLVVVIDALDECGGFEHWQPYQKQVIPVLSRLQSLRLRIKIFITSRNDAYIKSVLGSNGLHDCQVLEVGDNTTSKSTEDIKKYLEHGFADIAAESTTIKQPWPDPASLQLLANTAAGLFIWASTVLKLVGDGNPPKTLDAIIKTGTIVSSNGDPLAHLYNAILTSRFTQAEHISAFTAVVGAIITARTPLPAADLVQLLSGEQLDEYDVEMVYKKLASVLDTGSGLRFLHQSFPDFILALPVQNPFHYAKGTHERRMGSACLATMEGELHFNMANIETSYVMNADIPDLPERIPLYIWYGCRFWTSHIQHNDDPTLVQRVTDFFYLRFFFWLEVIDSRGGEGAVSALETLLEWEQLNDELRLLTQDTLTFVRYATPARLSIPQIYLSAIPFAPTGSRLRQLYAGRIANFVQSGGDVAWHPHQAVFYGHSCAVTSVSFSHDSKRICSASEDQTIKISNADIWNVENDRNDHGNLTLLGHTDIVNSVVFTPDDRRVVSASHDGNIIAWDPNLKMSQEVGRIALSGIKVYSVAVSPKHIVAGLDDHSVRVWDLNTYQQLASLVGHTGIVRSVTCSGNHALISGSNDGSIRVWDADTFSPVGEPLMGHEGQVLAVAISSDGTLIASGSYDEKVRIWDLQSQELLGVPLTGHIDPVTCVAFSWDKTILVSGSDDWKILLWDVQSGNRIGRVLEDHLLNIRGVAFSPDGKYLVSSDNDATIRLWSVHLAKQVADSPPGHTDYVNCVCFSPVDAVFASASYDSTIRIWDSSTYQQIGEPLTGHTNFIESIAFSRDGKQLVSGSHDCTVRSWDVHTQTEIVVLTGHTMAVGSIAVSPDLIASSSLDRIIKFWSIETHAEVASFSDGHEDLVVCIRFSPDASVFATASRDHTIRLWHAETHEPIGTLRGHTDSVQCIAFSPDSLSLVSGSPDGSILFWNILTHEQLGGPIQAHDSYVLSLDISPDGQFVVSGSEDCSVRLWDFQSRARVGGIFDGHTRPVCSVAFAPTGRKIVSGARDCTTRLWDAEISNPQNFNLLLRGSNIFPPM